MEIELQRLIVPSLTFLSSQIVNGVFEMWMLFYLWELAETTRCQNQ